MKNTLFFALAALVMSAAAQAADAPRTLKEVHGAMWPQNTTGFAIKGDCLKCHVSYKALAKKTADLEPNPHFSHMGEVNCVECHKPDADAKKPEAMCNDCHKFKFQKKTAAK
ncbi:cytochrome c3 family protein [uncultured Sutterella sp.]|uniref:cytochrome c3 family protein n=1 Tax=uncultured Sutterella sp. TaxID=286133 RepID=UPI00259BCFD4|nr:cytochrome c3 family protein [uncultured Sutterella sp.]